MNSNSLSKGIHLRSPEGVPYAFNLIIKHAERNAGYHLEVETNNALTHTYKLADKEHSSYMDFFYRLSKQFGLRTPLNRRPVVIPSFKANYQDILLQNIHPGILYGYGDPAVISVEENNATVYYIVVTSNDAPDSFPILKSDTLTDWNFIGHVFPENNKPLWAADGEMISDYWAPEIHKVQNEYRCYFVARDKNTRELCIGVASSSHPEQRFIAEPKPILTNNVIDPHVFVEDDGTSYLYWKEDNNDVWPAKLIALLFKNTRFISLLFAEEENKKTASFIVTLWPWAQTLQPMEKFQAIQIFIEAVTSNFFDFYNKLNDLKKDRFDLQNDIDEVLTYMKTPMYAQQLSADGTYLTGERIKIIENDLQWEAHLVEGMWLTKHNSRYYLFYAGNDFSTDQYGIGVAIADSAIGPFTKMPEQLLQSTAQWTAPGHSSVVIDANGTYQMFLHAYYPGSAGYKQFRALLSIPISFEKERVLIT